MKVKRVLMMLVMFASIAAQAQGYDDECQDMLRRMKKAYVERGEEDALRQIELLCKSCDPSICSEARAWLREQKNKSRNNNSYNEQTFNVNGVEFKMIKVEGGTFSMGATSEQGRDAYNDEKPVHSVTLSDYYIGETEVTQELWQAVMGSNPSEFKGNNQRPVESVSWNDFQEFIKKLNRLTGKNFRLPTEAEWEYAARGGKYSRGYKYSGSNDADEVAWYDDNSGRTTHSVKTKKANELGLYDMSGNVYEWCNDWYGDYQSNSQTNPTGPSKGEYCVLRGGSWFNNDRCVRVSYRHINTSGYCIINGGLRLALKTSQIEAPKKQYLPQNQSGLNEQTFRVKGVEFKMIKVEGGTFSMGATSEQEDDAFGWEKPVHSVTLSDYYIGETEVTQELWEAVMGSNPSEFKGDNQRPVESVSWNDCQEFIKKLNRLTGKEFRLPTEAEWEYAARGGKYSRGYKYSGSNDADEVAWYARNSGSTTHSVKTKKANELGLCDMSGNVYEWCNDWYGDYQSNSQTNPTGPSEGEFRVLRGGSWYNSDEHVRVSDRDADTPVSRSDGLRLAL